jgi:NAD(P)-dependent dehydrogenase (short-subunit alcohol dehydrogenase family)
MTISLAGQTIVITGGAKRLGRAIALECAQSGAHVVITFRDSADEARQTVAEMQRIAPGARFEAFPLEVSDGAAVRALADEVCASFPNVSGLVNNAAIFARTPFETLSEADFDSHIAANLKGPFLLSKAFGDRFLQRETAGEGGSILNIADIYGIRPLANYVPYCVSKAGLIMLTQSLAKALAPRVRVNCLCPGTILLPSQTQGEADDEADLIARIPVGRLGKTEEIAQTAVFLLGGPAFVTGATLPVDGAQSLR